MDDTWRAVLSAIVFVVLLASPANAVWIEDGLPVYTLHWGQNYPKSVPDGEGGVIIVWTDAFESNYDILAQRLDSRGEVLWNRASVPICKASGFQTNVRISSDGSGGLTRRNPGNTA